MGKGSRIKAQRAQRRATSTSKGAMVKSDIRRELDRRGTRRSDREIALWLARAVWKQQTDKNCIDASFTLSAALDLLGIGNRVVPVALIADHIPSQFRATSGTAALRHLAQHGALHEGQVPEPPADTADFWVDGGHAVVVCEGVDLILDPTVDQFGIERLPFVFAPFSDGHFDGEDFWQYTYGGNQEAPEVTVTYFEVSDIIKVDEVARLLSSVAGRELAFVGVVVDFDPAVIEEGTHALYPSTRFLDSITGQLDEGDFSTLERFRSERAKSLSALGHQDEVPLSWTVAPRPGAGI